MLRGAAAALDTLEAPFAVDRAAAVVTVGAGGGSIGVIVAGEDLACVSGGELTLRASRELSASCRNFSAAEPLMVVPLTAPGRAGSDG